MNDRLERLEHTIGLLLLAGGWLSTLLLLAGLVIRVTRGADRASQLLLHFGLLVLMGTPVLRVLVSCVDFFHERDWVFAATTLTVLLMLAVTLGVALSHGGV